MVIRNLTIALLFVALAFMNIGGCGGGDGDGLDCADIAGIILLLFTETSNDCQVLLLPPEIVTANCSQEGCSLKCTFTDEEGDEIDTTGSISEDGIINLFGTATFFETDPRLDPTIVDVELSCLFEVTDDGDFVDGACTESVEVEDELTGDLIFSCVNEFDVEEVL